MHRLEDKKEFPDPAQADFDGLLAVGGDLTSERLKLAYSKGIFPWFNEGEPIQWWSPNPRFVLFPEELKVSKSMKRLFKQEKFNVTVNSSFEEVMRNCSTTKREGQFGTWITEEMIAAYKQLFDLGYAKSIEVWKENNLVGGLYGVDVGNGVFCGESMFAKESNASKYGFLSFIMQSDYKLIDCQVYTAHLESLGAKKIERKEFLQYL